MIVTILLGSLKHNTLKSTDRVVAVDLDVRLREGELEGDIGSRATSHRCQNIPNRYGNDNTENLVGAPCVVGSLRGDFDVRECDWAEVPGCILLKFDSEDSLWSISIVEGMSWMEIKLTSLSAVGWSIEFPIVSGFGDSVRRRGSLKSAEFQKIYPFDAFS